MFYRGFYFRAPKIASIVGEMVRSPHMMKRRLREGVEFFQFLRDRNEAACKRGLLAEATLLIGGSSSRLMISACRWQSTRRWNWLTAKESCLRPA